MSSNRGRTRSAGRSAGARRSGASRPSGIAYVPQTHSPAFPFTVGEIVLMGRTPHVGLFSTPSEEDKRAVMRILDEMGMRDISDRSYTEISGGQRQMVLIARALVQDPSVLIMDEPASSLDLGNQSRLLTEIRELTRTRGLQVLMTTHNPNHALLVADKVLLIAQDTYWCGPCSEVLTEGRLSHAYGTDISIIEQELDGEPVRSCILRLNSERRFGK